MISYCIAVYRPTYARLLLADLVAKTSVPFEILAWLNVADPTLDREIEQAIAAGVPLRVIGRTPANIGMHAYRMLFREARFHAKGRPASAAAAYVMGLAFAFGWTPCIGPVLGPILTLAGGRETVGEGAMLLAAYSLGLGIPFLIAALFSGAFMRFLGSFRVHLGRVEKAIGALLVVAGLLFLTGGIQTASYWLLETFPRLGLLG